MSESIEPGISYFLAEDLGKFRDQFLSQCSSARLFPKETILSYSGNSNAPMYFILDGMVKIYTINPQGYTRILGYHRQNTLCALDRIRPEDPAIVTVECVTSVEALPVFMEDLLEMSKNDPEFTYRLLRYYGKVLRLMCFDAEVKSIDSVKTRIASFLYLYARSLRNVSSYEIKLTQEELSYAVNASRVQVARISSEFQKKGLIDCKRGRIIILDKEKLLAVSSGAEV
ncbi:MAG: Crp/Fnr family transcriptional regulator [Clostridia bacterium]|nr:Crp/Fnr family transcriptional regulator [Clostridia bacterium]